MQCSCDLKDPTASDATANRGECVQRISDAAEALKSPQNELRSERRFRAGPRARREVEARDISPSLPHNHQRSSQRGARFSMKDPIPSAASRAIILSTITCEA